MPGLHPQATGWGLGLYPFEDNPRLYAWLPWAGDHRRVGRRLALYHRRNSSETLNACVQAWGLGLPGKAGLFFCNKTFDMEWFAGMVLAGQTLRRLAHESGAYEEAPRQADAVGLLTPETAPEAALEDGEAA